MKVYDTTGNQFTKKAMRRGAMFLRSRTKATYVFDLHPSPLRTN
jgi:hypothetical protein